MFANINLGSKQYKTHSIGPCLEAWHYWESCQRPASAVGLGDMNGI